MNLLLFAASAPPFELELDTPVALTLAIFLVFLNGFFVASEFALVKVRPTQIEPHAARGSRRGKTAQHVTRHLDAYLSATQLGITLASLALGWVGEPAFARLLEPLFRKLPGASPTLIHSASLVVAFMVISILHIVLGELAPKSLAIRKPEATSLWTGVPLFLFYQITYPAIWVLNHAANAVLNLVGIEPLTEGELAQTEEEVRLLLSSKTHTELPEHQRELLDNVFDLFHRNARQIMVPRADVVYLSTANSLEENLEIARRSGHTRFPLCNEDVDHVIGVVHIKDLFRAEKTPTSLAEVKRTISFVPETLSADRLLRRMRAEKLHMAAVLDEYGGVSGIVTLENVIEEIVGEIQDEFDFEKPELIQLGPTEYQVSGSMLVDELEEELDLEFSDRDEDTIAGVVLSELGRRARVGDQVELASLRLKVNEIDGNRIRSLRLKLDTSSNTSEEFRTKGG